MGFAGSYNMPVENIAREFYFNIGGPHGFMRWGIYIFMFAAFGYLIYSVVKKVKVWRLGKSELRIDRPYERIKAIIKYVVFQSKIMKDKWPGVMHAAFFFGFLVLFAVTMIIVVQEDFTGLIFGYHFIHGNFYLIWSLFGDVFGVVVLVGLAMAIYRRYISKPDRLDNKLTDLFALLLITGIVVTGFTNEALRIAMVGFETETARVERISLHHDVKIPNQAPTDEDFAKAAKEAYPSLIEKSKQPVAKVAPLKKEWKAPDFEKWSPVGYALAVPFSTIGANGLSVVHKISWWVHMLAAFLFIGLIASNKLGHIVVSTLNIFFMNLDNEDPKTKYALRVINPEEFEVAESFGVANVEEYTWKQLMDGDACTRCGRCQDVCPAYLTEKPLTPKKMINDVKDNMEERLPLVMETEDVTTIECTPLLDGAVKADEFWSCTNCGACMEVCPVNIEHVPKMIDMRRYKVLMEGDAAPELLTTFQNLESNFNPYGFAFAERAKWIEEEEDISVKTLSEDTNVDYLYFVGSAASYDKANQEVAKSFVRIMQKAGVKLGILGSEEADSGDAAIRGGNEYLFHALATQNLELFKAYGVKKIICTCPHDYNVIKKEYKKFAAVAVGSDGEKLSADYEVYHHTEIIDSLIKDEKIKLVNPLEKEVTWHDSCFLGRYNEIYEAPRNIIKAIPGVIFKEMSRNHEKSFCCGAGGARMFIEEHLGTRINQFRTKDAEASGASQIVTGCPFCNTMLSDGPIELGLEDKLVTNDIAELVWDAMEK